jgi:hypothetical protein
MNFTAEQIQENWATFILNIESYISIGKIDKFVFIL